MTEYTSVKVPKVLAKQIEKKAFPYGYRSVSEFMLEATRIRLIQMERL